MSSRYLTRFLGVTVAFSNNTYRISRLKCPLWMFQKERRLHSYSLESSGNLSRPSRRRPEKMYNTWNQQSCRTGYRRVVGIAVSRPGGQPGCAFPISVSRATPACSRLRGLTNFPYRHSFRPNSRKRRESAICNRPSVRSAGEGMGVASTSHSCGALSSTNVTIFCLDSSKIS